MTHGRLARAGFAVLLFSGTVGVARAGTAAMPAKSVAAPTVDIRAFGDSGYVGGLGVFAEPNADWVKNRLRNVEALRSKDVNFLNLEGALTRSCARFLEKPFTFAIAPAALKAFTAWGFNLIGLANNHSLDCLDPAPGRETTLALGEALEGTPAVKAHGVASSWSSLVNRPAVLEVRGVKIGMAAMKAWGNGRRALIGNLDNRDDVMAGLAKAPVDVRILSLHGGVENTRRPTEDVMGIARSFIARYGGDIVFAHHPHKSQGFEIVRKLDGKFGVIFYSLGNGLHNGLSANGDGLVAKIAAGKGGVDLASLAVFPLVRPAVKPRLASPAELDEISGVLRDSSAAIALRPLPSGLARVPFVLERIQAPGVGLKLVPGDITGKVTTKTKTKALAKAVRKAKPKAVAKRPVRKYGRPQWASTTRTRGPSRWLPPPDGVPVVLKKAH